MRVVRSLAVLFGLILVAAVSGAYADQIGGRFHEDTNYIQIEPAMVYHASLHQLPIAATMNAYGMYGENHESWRIRGIRDGHWFRLWLKDGWKMNDDSGDGNGGSGSNGGPSDPSPVATPEPGTLLLLGAGLFIARRRVLNS